jgi:ATP-dependent Clp protease ATP-binding subunit ClpA
VIFEPLSQDKLRVVANVQLKGIIDRLAEKGINIYASEAVLDVVLSESHNPVSTLSSFLLTYMTLLCFFS